MYACVYVPKSLTIFFRKASGNSHSDPNVDAYMQYLYTYMYICLYNYTYTYVYVPKSLTIFFKKASGNSHSDPKVDGLEVNVSLL
jgi:hypothetical protein